MRVSVLASGSKGNATFIELDHTRILIDAGVSMRRIQKELQALGTDIKELDAICITHEHIDHMRGLVTLLKRHSVPLFSRRATLEELARAGVPTENFHALEAEGNNVKIGKIRVRAFSIPHDAADPVGYQLLGTQKCTLATDLGFVTSAVQAELEGADALVLEANHDMDMLKNGSYPWNLKQRILSNRGHLSNMASGWAIARMKKRPKKIILAHMSKQNNRIECVERTVRQILEKEGISDIISLQIASQEKACHMP